MIQQQHQQQKNDWHVELHEMAEKLSDLRCEIAIQVNSPLEHEQKVDILCINTDLVQALCSLNDAIRKLRQ